RRAQKTLHNLLRRIEQAARRIELNHETLRVLPPGFFNTSHNVTGRCRTNRSVDPDKRNLFRSEGCRCCCAGEPENQAARRSLHSVDANRGAALRKLKLLSSVEA